MKQEMISFLSTIEDEIRNVSKYIYENSEESFHENKSYTYLLKLLNKYSFKIQEKYLDIDTAFKAEFGSGHPKICFLCQYDGSKNNGQIYGYNLQSAMSVGAAISLSKVIPKIGGSIVVIGCPGEISGGSKLTMVHQGAFEDLDIVLMTQPYTKTFVIGNSKAVLPIEIKYKNLTKTFQEDSNIYSPMDTCIFTFDAINLILKGFENTSSIKSIDLHSSCKNKSTTETTARFLLTTSKIKIAEDIQNKISDFMNFTEKLLNIESELHIYDLPCKEIILNNTLNRLFSHNLKEMGITDIIETQSIDSCLSLGNVSHIVPSIDYCIDIIENKNVKYGTKDFAIATQSDFANKMLIKTVNALSTTALDLIERESLISEAKMELYSKINKLTYSLI